MSPKLVQTIRRLLLVLIAAVVLAIAWNSVDTWLQRMRTAQNLPEMLGSELMQAASGFEYSENRNGIPRYKIRAERLLETRGGVSRLEGIEAVDYDEGGSVRNSVRSLKAEYDREGKTVDFVGDVRMRLGDGAELRMESIHYDLTADEGTAPGLVSVHSGDLSGRAGKAGYAGRARGVHYKRQSGTLTLKEDVHLKFRAGASGSDAESELIQVTSRRAVARLAEDKIFFQGSARLSDRSVGDLSGEAIELELTPEPRKFKRVAAQGGAVYRFSSETGSREARGGRIDFDIDESGCLEKVSVTDQAELRARGAMQEEILTGSHILILLEGSNSALREIQAEGSVRFRMVRAKVKEAAETIFSGEEMRAEFSVATRLPLQVEMQRNAELVFVNDSERNELRAAKIQAGFRDRSGRLAPERLHATGSVRWRVHPASSGIRNPQSARSLSARTLNILFDKEGFYPAAGDASDHVVFSEISAGAPQRTITADVLRFGFFPGTVSLRSLEADGNVRTRYEAEPEDRQAEKRMREWRRYETESEHMRVDLSLRQPSHKERSSGASAVEKAEQWGRFLYKDETYTAAAERGRFDGVRGLLTLEGNPRITEASSVTTGDRASFDRVSQTLHVVGKVRTELRRTAAKPNSVPGKSPSMSDLFKGMGDISGIIVTADTLEFKMEAKRLRYEGTVRVLSESQHLHAGELGIDLGHGSDGIRIDAGGGVRHLLFPHAAMNPAALSPDPTIIESSTLRYLRKDDLLTYEKGVLVHSGDLLLSAEHVDAWLDPKNKDIRRALARENVVLVQNGRRGRGAEAEWLRDADSITLIGSPAEIVDPGKGRSRARRLTYFRGDDRILLEDPKKGYK